MNVEKDPSEWRQFFRVLRLSFGPNAPLRRRLLAKEAERAPTGLAAWSLAHDLWREGDVAEAYRLAEKVLQAKPTDFEMLLICLDYHVRARDSTQIYTFAKRLIATKSTAYQMLGLYKALSVFLWPLELLGFGRKLRRRADHSDRWVLWAKKYLASRPAEIPRREIAETQPQKETWSVTWIILLILLIALLVYWVALSTRKSSLASSSYATREYPVEPAARRSERLWDEQFR